jgi:hypothetical protein
VDVAGTKKRLNAGMFAAALCLSGPAHAGGIPFAVSLGRGVQLTGTVNQDDSSGDMNSAVITAAGPVTGTFTLTRADPRAEMDGPGLKLRMDFDHGDQSVSAYLDTCATPDKCDPGAKVTLWEK